MLSLIKLFLLVNELFPSLVRDFVKKKTYAFESFTDSLNSLEYALVNGQSFAAVAYGHSSFLISEASHVLKNKAKSLNLQHVIVDLGETQGKKLEDLWKQVGLFSSQSFYTVYGLERSKEGLKQLSKLCNIASEHSFLFLLTKDLIPKEVQGKVKSIFCPPPLYQNLPKAVQWSAKQLGLTLEPEATQALINLNGSDLHSIKNCLMIAHLKDPETKVITVDSLVNGGIFLREDEAIKLSNLILEGSTSEALVLMHDLIARGESPLGILGIMSRLLRTSISFLMRRPDSNLPPHVARQYTNYGQKKSLSSLALALRECSLADISLKSNTKASDFIILANLLHYF